jgi:hypothetical protein
VGSIPGCFSCNIVNAGLFGLFRWLVIERGLHPGRLGSPPASLMLPEAIEPISIRFLISSERTTCTKKSHPLGSLGSGDESESLCAFLASLSAELISGASPCMDGSGVARSRNLATPGSRSFRYYECAHQHLVGCCTHKRLEGFSSVVAHRSVARSLS